MIDQGPRTYVERIEIHGNTRTRDYVIRREFDFGEGDPYNKTLIDRAERRLKNLNYFKTVKISSRPGSSPDRVVLDVETVDQPTGDFIHLRRLLDRRRLAGARSRLSERNFYGTGYDLKSSATFGQYARGINLSASEPYFLGTRSRPASSCSAGKPTPTAINPMAATPMARHCVFGTPLTEQLGVQWRYSLYNQNITLAPARQRPHPIAGGAAGRSGRPRLGLAGRNHDRPSARSTTTRARPAACGRS